MTGSSSSNEANSLSKILIVAMLFFLSGASSLIYQVIWTRQMVFVFGSSTFASATVLSAFMGGLALGSFFAGKWADRVKNPFLIYGILEGIIGIWALAAPFMFDAALPIYKAFWHSLHLQILPFSLLRFAVVAMILLVPTACMGATLPLLSRFITNSLNVVGERVGTLYSINTLGAVCGATCGGFFLIPEFGLRVSTITAAVTNILLMLCVLVLSKSWPAFAGLVRESAERKTEPGKKEKLPKSVFLTMIAFGCSGAIAMVYEVAWTRSLLLIIGSTTYAFTIMLSTFLLGIFIGSFFMSRFADKVKNPCLWFSQLQLLLGAAGVVSMVLFNYLPYFNLVANNHNYFNPGVGMAVRFLLAGSIMVPIALFLGATFPLAVKTCATELERVGNSVGTLYSVNTLGAILGSFAGGFLVIPALGGEQTLVSCAAANALIGIGILLTCVEGKQSLKIAGSVAAAAILVWALGQPKVWNLYMLTASQKMRRGMNFSQQDVPPFEKWAQETNNAFKILFWKDGLCANVAVVRFKDNQSSLFTNGHIDASDGITDMPTQALLPAIPCLLKADKANDIADVGWGSGCTMGYALMFPDVKSMVCAEIEPAVVETSTYFHSVNMAPEKDPRLRMEFNDGRNFLLATDEKFDIITSEPSNPWQAGVCNLYTQEYFQVCHDRLKPGGIFTMWWQCNEVSHDNLARVFAALKKVYKHLVVFQTFPGDIAACASDDPVKINLEAIDKLLKSPTVKDKLAKYGAITVPEDLALKVLMADDGTDKAVKGVPANTDDKNHIEFDVAKTYEHTNFSIQNAKWFMENSGSLWDAIDWGNATVVEKSNRMAGIAERAMVRDSIMAMSWAEESYRLNKNAFALCVQALILAQKRGDFQKAFETADSACKNFPGDVRPICVKGVIALLAGAPMRARQSFEEALKIEPNNKVYKFRLAQTYMPDTKDWYQIANLPISDIGKANTDPQKALELVAPVLNDARFLMQNPTALGIAGNAFLLLGRTEDAAAAMQSYLKVRREDYTGLKIMAEIYKRKGDAEGEKFCTNKANELSSLIARKLVASALANEKAKRYKFALGSIKRTFEFSPANAEARVVLHRMAAVDPDAEQMMKDLANFSFEDLQAYKELQSSKKKN